MQHFQLILIVIGIIAILAVLIHGYIVSRRENKPVTDSLSMNDDCSSENRDEIADDVHIMRTSSDDEEIDFSVPLENNDSFKEHKFDDDLSMQIFADDETKQGDENHFSEPLAMHGESAPEAELMPGKAENKQPPQEVEDFFVFNVAAKEGKYVRGHELLQFFLTAGFRFGEMSIFHRHLHSDGTGPILFSIANMMTPGVFNPEEMEQFRSQGVSFFLTAPNDEINIKEAFDMMLVAVEQMAEEFDCVVLNAEREPMTEAQFRDYHKRLLRYI